MVDWSLPNGSVGCPRAGRLHDESCALYDAAASDVSGCCMSLEAKAGLSAMPTMASGRGIDSEPAAAPTAVGRWPSSKSRLIVDRHVIVMRAGLRWTR